MLIFSCLMGACVALGEHVAKADTIAERTALDSLTHQKALLLLDSAEVVKSIFEDEHRALDLVNRSLVLTRRLFEAICRSRNSCV